MAVHRIVHASIERGVREQSVGEETRMDRQGQAVAAPGQSSDFQQTADEMRKLFADAPPFAKTALENVLHDAQSMPPAKEQIATPRETAGRIGSRRGKVSELTVIAPLRP